MNNSEEKQFYEFKNKLKVINALHNLSRTISLTPEDRVYLETLKEGVFMIRATYLSDKLNNKLTDKRKEEILDKFSRTNQTFITIKDIDIIKELSESGEFMIEATLELRLLNLYRDERIAHEKRQESKRRAGLALNEFVPPNPQGFKRAVNSRGIPRGGSLRKTKKGINNKS
jgi:hypothetical protein